MFLFSCKENLFIFYLVHSINPIIHSFISMIVIEMIIVINMVIGIFDKLFMKMKGVIREISRSKIRNKMVNIKKFVEKGIFNMVFSLNPHSKFVWFMLCFLFLFRFINSLIINRNLLIISVRRMIFVRIISFFPF